MSDSSPCPHCKGPLEERLFISPGARWRDLGPDPSLAHPSLSYLVWDEADCDFDLDAAIRVCADDEDEAAEFAAARYYEGEPIEDGLEWPCFVQLVGSEDPPAPFEVTAHTTLEWHAQPEPRQKGEGDV